MASSNRKPINRCENDKKDYAQYGYRTGSRPNREVHTNENDVLEAKNESIAQNNTSRTIQTENISNYT